MSFISAFAGRIQDGRADVIVVEFDKNQSNDQRNMLMNEGRKQLEDDNNVPRHIFDGFEPSTKDEIKDILVESMLEDLPLAATFE